MSLLIGFLTFVIVMNCLFLMLLILIQLPKKEAGAGIAFGGAATDALFGAGSGNALTKMTKYAGTLFVGLSILLSVLHMQASRQGSRRLQQELSRQANTPAASVLPVATNAPIVVQPTPVVPPVTTNLIQALTNAPAAAPAINLESPAAAPVTPPPAVPANSATDTPAAPVVVEPPAATPPPAAPADPPQ